MSVTFYWPFFLQATVFCIELDCQIVDIAKKWFCLSEDSNVKPVVADGLEFMISELQQGIFIALLVRGTTLKSQI